MSQQGPLTELLVIDGASTDGTAAWLDARRASLTFVSEPDGGIYDAMNKGLARARGEWVYFLGADDRLVGPDVLRKVAACAATSAAADVLAGEAVFADGRRYRFRDDVSFVPRNPLHHQAAFYRRALFARHGGYDPGLRIMGDYDLNFRLRAAGARFAAMPVTVATCGAGGLSDAGTWCGYREEIRVRHRHAPAWTCLPWDAGSVARFIRKKLLRLHHG